MSTLKESGVLPVGVELAGKVHRDFEMRPRLVRDSIEAMEDPRAQTNDAYRGAALIAAQVVSLGSLKGDEVTTDLLLSMYDADMAVLMEAASRLEGRLMTFRADGQDTAAGASGAG